MREPDGDLATALSHLHGTLAPPRARRPAARQTEAEKARALAAAQAKRDRKAAKRRAIAARARRHPQEHA